MRLRIGVDEGPPLWVYYAVVDWDGFALLTRVPPFAVISPPDRRALAAALRWMRAEVRRTRNTRPTIVPATGTLNG